jgi:hypothetical protein
LESTRTAEATARRRKSLVDVATNVLLKDDIVAGGVGISDHGDDLAGFDAPDDPGQTSTLGTESVTLTTPVRPGYILRVIGGYFFAA